MPNHKVLAVWFLWLLAVVQPGAAWPGKQHKQKQRHGAQGQQQQQQEPLNAFMGVLAAQTAPAVAAYQSVLAYNHSLALPLRANGLVYRGSSARLRRVLSKLTRGEPVHVAAVGSAITYGRGVKRGTSDWFTLFSSWLQAAFPAAKVTVKNHALPAARSEYLSACLDQHIDPLADLVFVELTAADGYLDTSINNEQVHAFERLVRKLLKLPNKPAVVVLNALQASSGSTTHSSVTPQQLQQQQQARPPGDQKGAAAGKQPTKQQAKPGTGLQQQQQQQQQQPFYHTIEDHFGVVAQFYELQWLSVRNAAWQGLAHGWEGFRLQELFTEVKHPGHPHRSQQQQQQQKQQQHHKQQQPHAAASTNPAPSAQQQNHQQPQNQQQQQQQGASPVTSRHLQQQASLLPSTLNHKYMADLAVHLLQQTFLQQLLRPLGPSDAAAAADGELRGPMFPGNWEGHGSGCAAGLDLRAAVRDAHRDWYFVTEGTPAHPRWGFVSHTPNASLVLHLDTRSKGADRAVPQLTTPQKVQLLQRHGMFREATELLTAEGAVPMPRPIQIPQSLGPKGGADQAAAAAAGLKIWQGNGLEAAMAEAERQAAEAAIQLRLGQVKPYVNSERIVGANPYSALQLPAEARLEVGKTQTGTGVEVILPSKVGHRRRLQQQQQQQQQQQELTADDLLSSSRKRELHAAANPLLVPPPYDAVYLKPGAAGGGGAGASKPSNNSSGGAVAAPGTVGASIFSEYSLRPQPNMVVFIGYLKGPRMMGRARISCVSGCSCSPLTVDGWHAHPHMRLATAKLHVTQSPECLVEVQVLPQSSSGHHKFKVTGVLVSQSVHYTSPDSEWAHQYLLHPDLLPVTTE